MKIALGGGPRWHWPNIPLPEPHLGLIAGGLILAWISIYLGVALVLNTRWLIILSPLLLALVHRSIMAEERQLEQRLGDDYRVYKKRVRRYL